jgi:hypothetical protein
MRSLPCATRRLGGVLAVAVLLTLPSPTSAATGTRLVTVSGLTVAVPAPGLALSVSALTTDRSEIDVILETDASGVTRVVAPDPTTTTGAALTPASTIVGPCKDGAYHRLPFRWTRNWQWWFNAASTPLEITRAGAEGHLLSAVRSITGERNNCGRSDRVSARATYLGRTKLHPMVRSDASCGGGDGRSVVGFGTLPQFVVGLTCTTFTIPSRGLGQALESDVLLNKALMDWSTSPRTCSGPSTMIVRSVATHEFGHVFGLDHVDETTHPNLTMSTGLGACDDSAYTLGLGDMRALESRY